MTALIDMNPLPAESEPLDRPKPPMKFAYASGSRPLEGYTIKRGVGRGGFGEVYFAVSDAGKEVAIKLIRRNLDVELRGVTHCLNLKHPNLIAVYDIRTDDHDDHWVIMEYVSGASLEDVVDRYPGGMPRDMALHWFEGLCAGVAYLHDHGIVHRDLKPANIFLDEGCVKIGDYGLSKFISCSRRSGQTESVGTVHYMAPEIANGRYGREIDAYALGIILYEMLTGHVPFEGESVGEVLMKHLTAEPCLDSLEEPFRTVVQRAMAKDPEQRINSPTEMVSRLRGVPYVADEGKPHPLRDAATVDMPWRKVAGAATADGVGHVPPQQPYTPFDRAASPGSPPGSAPTSPVDEEPILAAVQNTWRELKAHLAQMPPFPRAMSVLLGVGALLWSFEYWIAMVIPVAVAYGIYRLIRHVIIPTSGFPKPGAGPLAGAFGSPHAPPAFVGQAAAPGAPAAKFPIPPLARETEIHLPRGTASPWRRRTLATWRQAAEKHLTSKTARQRVDEVVTSMLMAAFIAALASTAAAFFAKQDLGFDLYLWTAIVTTVASWAIIVPAKLSEGRVEDQAPLRLTQLFLGALVGVVAWLAADGLGMALPTNHTIIGPSEAATAALLTNGNRDLDAAYRAGAVVLPLAMHAAYFAFLFVLLRWWRNADWTRATRVSIWSVAWCGFIGWMVSLFWWYPQPIGALVAGATALTVQLSTAWLPPSKRREFAATTTA